MILIFIAEMMARSESIKIVKGSRSAHYGSFS